MYIEVIYKHIQNKEYYQLTQNGVINTPNISNATKFIIDENQFKGSGLVYEQLKFKDELNNTRKLKILKLNENL